MSQFYYLNQNNVQCGPVEAANLPAYGVTVNTMVWQSGMANWQPAGQVSELQNIFTQPPQPPQSPIPPNYAAGGVRPIKPDNNMVFAVLTTLFCCLPLGIYSIVLASKVNGLYESGKYQEAQHSADEAKKWAIIAAVISVLFWVILVFIYMIEYM
jgi:hypothetical protein